MDDEYSATVGGTWAGINKACGSVPPVTPTPFPDGPGRGINPTAPFCDQIGGNINTQPGEDPPGLTTMTYSTSDGTAKAGVDYVAVTNKTVTIPAGAPFGSLPFQLIPREPGTTRRWFTVRITSVSSGVIVKPVAVVTLEPV
jgi:hypothetical protein